MRDVVYFGLRDGLVKIGTTCDLRGRMYNLSQGHSAAKGTGPGPIEVLATMPGDRVVERAMHEMFKPMHFDKEWFLYQEPLTTFIRTVAAVGAALGCWYDRALGPRIPPTEETVTLAEAIEERTLPWRKDATKARMKRARAAGQPVPEPVGKRGRQADLYRRADLAAWVEAERQTTS